MIVIYGMLWVLWYMGTMVLWYYTSLVFTLSGLKVIGGKMTMGGYLGAFITKVKRGSIAETVGQLRAG